jgi:L-threonine-O-3-phosphate decarboxylase
VDRPLHGGNLVWAAQLAQCSPKAILDFSASINPLGPPASAIAAIQSHLQDLTSYPDPNYHQLRDALSRFHNIPKEWILPGNGAADLLTWACRDLANLDATYLITPAFSDYWRALNAFGAKVVQVPLGDFGFPISDFGCDLGRTLSGFNIHFSKQNSSNCRGILINNPHNPTGQLVQRDSLLSLLEQFALVVVDEAFMDFLLPEEQQSLIGHIQDYPNLVVVRSLTKFYSLPGLRLGYAIAHPERLQRWQQWRDPWAVNTLAAAVGTVVLQDISFQQETWEWLSKNRPQLSQALIDLPGLRPLPSAANFLLVRSEKSVVQLQTELLKQHQVFIRDCLSFAALGDRYFRIATRRRTENQRLIQSLANILPLI